MQTSQFSRYIHVTHKPLYIPTGAIAMPNAQLAPINPSDLFKFKYILSAALSPSGKQIAYVVSHIDAETEKDFSPIWLMDIASGEAGQFPSGTAVDAAPKWSPDG